MKENINIQKYWQFCADRIETVETMPEILVDGFIADFNSHGINKDVIPHGKKRRTLPPKMLMVLLLANQPLKHQALARAGEENTLVDVLKTADNKTVLIQHRYYEYFKRVYPKCSFFMPEKLIKSKHGDYYYGIVKVRKGYSDVGAIAPFKDGVYWYEISE